MFTVFFSRQDSSLNPAMVMGDASMRKAPVPGPVHRTFRVFDTFPGWQPV
jgi:hypothetical protein